MTNGPEVSLIYQEVTCITFAHIALAIVSYVDLPNLKESEKCNPTINSEREKLDIYVTPSCSP